MDIQHPPPGPKFCYLQEYTKYSSQIENQTKHKINKTGANQCTGIFAYFKLHVTFSPLMFNWELYFILSL